MEFDSYFKQSHHDAIKLYRKTFRRCLYFKQVASDCVKNKSRSEVKVFRWLVPVISTINICVLASPRFLLFSIFVRMETEIDAKLSAHD